MIVLLEARAVVSAATAAAASTGGPDVAGPKFGASEDGAGAAPAAERARVVTPGVCGPTPADDDRGRPRCRAASTSVVLACVRVVLFVTCACVGVDVVMDTVVDVGMDVSVDVGVGVGVLGLLLEDIVQGLGLMRTWGVGVEACEAWIC